MYKYFIEFENVVDAGPVVAFQSALFDTPKQAHDWALLICFVNDGYELKIMRQWQNRDGTYKDAEFVRYDRD